ncbi:MAG: uncharacterized protein KVP18_001023 [Porospora cf. gigantea A]|uniref:uncharacterized protein n=1 Tax=Porospora cf. gigantea A TaxID=2853593 RepID=UPI0035594D0A|nr:MAG: hypothetical protein KVP18_001023 [Porospora cf. gigantea A]
MSSPQNDISELPEGSKPSLPLKGPRKRRPRNRKPGTAIKSDAKRIDCQAETPLTPNKARRKRKPDTVKTPAGNQSAPTPVHTCTADQGSGVAKKKRQRNRKKKPPALPVETPQPPPPRKRKRRRAKPSAADVPPTSEPLIPSTANQFGLQGDRVTYNPTVTADVPLSELLELNGFTSDTEVAKFAKLYADCVVLRPIPHDFSDDEGCSEGSVNSESASIAHDFSDDEGCLLETSEVHGGHESVPGCDTCTSEAVVQFDTQLASSSKTDVDSVESAADSDQRIDPALRPYVPAQSSHVIGFVVKPSDPDIQERVAECFPAGLVCLLAFPASYPSAATAGEVPRLSIINKHEVADFVAEACQRVFSAEVASMAEEAARVHKFRGQLRPSQLFWAICGVRAVDTHFATILRLYAQALRRAEWTSEDQKALEAALVYCKHVKEPKQKWKLISQMVKTKTAKQCVARFQQLHKQAVASRKAVAPAPEEKEVSLNPSFDDTIDPNIRAEDAMREDSPTDLAPNSADQTLTLEEVTSIGVNLFQLVAVSLEISCQRCHKRPTFRLGFPVKQGVVKPNGALIDCIRCGLRTGVKAIPALAFGTAPVLRFQAIQCTVLDILSSDFQVTCGTCDALVRVKSVSQGLTRTTKCPQCHSSLRFGFGRGVVGGQPTQQAQGKSLVSKRKKQVLPIKLGTALPNNGACKHYKKSTKWYRFPCCGRLYACDICHDDAEQHESDFASRLMCGFCSKEQASSNEQCSSCNKMLVAKFSAHWEGGKGCRNAQLMSTKDNAKSRLLRKQRDERRKRLVATAKKK